jgi:surface polysaccharide O-acyltransferase-like enzyme
VSSSVFYYLLGSYAHRYLKLNGSLTVAGLGSLALAGAGVVMAALVQGRYPKWLIRPECPLVALWALLLFLLAKRHLLRRPVPRVVDLCSQLSLAIYLVHPLPLVVLYRRLWWMPYQQLPPVLFELAVLAIVYGISVPLAYGLKRLPGLRSVL